MPVDQQTGLYSPNAGIYPGGGLSGVASALSNIDATGIAKQEAQKRQAALMLQQMQARNTEAEAQQRASQNEQLQRELAGQSQYQDWAQAPENQDASFDQMSKKAIALGAVGPQQLSTMSWRGMGSESKDLSTKWNAALGNMRNGMDVDMSFAMAGLDDSSIKAQGFDPAKVKTNAQSLIAQREAKTEELGSQTNLNKTKAAQINALTPGMVQNEQAKTMLYRAQADLAHAKALTEQADLEGTGPKAQALRVRAQALAAPYLKYAEGLRRMAQNEPMADEKVKLLQQADALESQAKQYSGSGAASSSVASGGTSTLAKPDTSTQAPGFQLPPGARLAADLSNIK